SAEAASRINPAMARPHRMKCDRILSTSSPILCTKNVSPRISFRLDIRLADNAAVLVILLADEGGKIIQAGADRIKSEFFQFRLCFRHLHCCLEPGRKLGGHLLGCLRGREDAEPDFNSVVPEASF